MKNIVAIMWHGSYNILSKLKPRLNEYTNLKIYSSRLLDEEKQDIDELIKDIETCDALILNKTSTDSIWDEIDNIIDNMDNTKVYIGGESSLFINNEKGLEISSKCNTYITYSGEENWINMIKYILCDVLNEKITYKEPIEIPWDGIYHCDTNEIFASTKDYLKYKKQSNKGTIGLITSRGYWVNKNIEIEKKLIKAIEDKGYSVIPIFTYTLRNEEIGAKGTANAVRTFFIDEDNKPIVDAVIKMTSFFLDSDSKNYTNLDNANKTDILITLNCPIFQPITSSYMTAKEWEDDRDGTIKDIAWSIALPELEGVIEPIFIGALDNNDNVESRVAISDRCEKLINRVIKYVNLHKKPNSEKKVVFLLNNNPCASLEASIGGGANLDTLESVSRVLSKMKELGYDLEDIPKDGKELVDTIMNKKAISEFRWTTVEEIIKKGGALDLIEKGEYIEWFNKLSKEVKENMIENWGNPPGETIEGVSPSMIYKDKIVVTGVNYKNALVCVQPKRGCAGSKCDGAVCKILHDPHTPPTHQYLATYRYFEEKYKADVIIHVGTHGNLEFLPGKGVGLSQNCYPDICIGNLPNLYIYNADNPPEGTIAKRRSYATIIDHMQTLMTQGGLYDELIELENLLEQYEKVKVSDKTQAHLLKHLIVEEIKKANLETQIDISDHHNKIEKILEECHKVLSFIKNTQIQDGQHILGKIPEGDRLVELINSIIRFEGLDKESLRNKIASLIGLNLKDLLDNKEKINDLYQISNGNLLFELDILSKEVINLYIKDKSLLDNIDIFKVYQLKNIDKLDEIEDFKEKIIDIKNRIEESKEIDSLLKAMNGEYISAGPSGVITRGRDDILPTGRNFYTLDPYRIPTKVSYEVGRRLGDKVIEKYLEETGTYPENFAIYWMCNDILWSDGEGMAQLLYLIGTRPTWSKNGRVNGFEIIPLEELNRPRIDVTVRISGILRDNFSNSVDLLDGAIEAVSRLDEPIDKNYIRKHTLENNSSSRIFGTRPGTYLSGINMMVYSSAWKEKNDFLDVFTYYNGYSYGKNKYGQEAYSELNDSLKTIDITYNKAISDEHDLLGCCAYFGAHGGLTAAAKQVSTKEVKTYYGDTREVSSVEVRTLSEEIRRVVRGKLLNPKWIEGQKRHGYKGASDISKRIGRVYGWDATTDEVDDWIFDEITNTFVLDDENRKFFEENNPWALEEISRRLIEAYERNLWEADEDIIEELKDYYIEMEGWIEEGMGDIEGDFQGGSIDIIDLNEIESFREKLYKIKS